MWPTFMRERLRESLQLLNRASHSVTDLLSRAMPFIWGVERDTGNKDRSFSTKAMHSSLFDIPLRPMCHADLFTATQDVYKHIQVTYLVNTRASGTRDVSRSAAVGKTVGNLGHHFSVRRILTAQSAYFHHNGPRLRKRSEILKWVIHYSCTSSSSSGRNFLL